MQQFLHSQQNHKPITTMFRHTDSKRSISISLLFAGILALLGSCSTHRAAFTVTDTASTLEYAMNGKPLFTYNYGMVYPPRVLIRSTNGAGSFTRCAHWREIRSPTVRRQTIITISGYGMPGPRRHLKEKRSTSGIYTRKRVRCASVGSQKYAPTAFLPC